MNNVGPNPSALFQPPPHRARPDGWSSSPRRPPFARFTVLLFQPTALHANVIGAAACVHFWVSWKHWPRLFHASPDFIPTARAHRDDIRSPSPMTNQALVGLHCGWVGHPLHHFSDHIDLGVAIFSEPSLNCNISQWVIRWKILHHSPESTQIFDDDWKLHQCWFAIY